MELLYFWVGKAKTESKAFENIGINLSSKYLIDFDCENKKITIKPNNNYNGSFYCLSSMEEIAKPDLKCIVGKNGAGKTRLLELIQNIIVGSYSPRLEYDSFIIVFKDNCKIYYDFKLDAHKELLIDSKLKLDKKRFYYYSESKPKIGYDIRPQDNMCVISYNPFTGNNRPLEINDRLVGLYDIRTSNLIEVDSKRLRENKVEGFSDKIEDHRMMELKRTVYFYTNEENKNFLDEKFYGNNLRRDYFTLEPIKSDFELHKGKYSNRVDILSSDLSISFKLSFDIFYENARSFLKSKLEARKKDEKSIFLWKIVAQMWLLFVDYITSWSSFVNGDTKILEKYTFKSDNPEKFITEVLDIFKSLFIPTNEIYHYKHNINNIKDMLTNFVRLINAIIYQNGNSSKLIGGKLYIPLKNKFEKTVNELINIYAESMQNLITGEYVRFGFEPKFSSGEQSLITLFSRLYSAIVLKEHKHDEIFERDGLILLLDEGDAAYHPEWHKNYMYAVISYINLLQEKYLRNINNLQIIFTTNSPMILSDVLKDDVIYLEDMRLSSGHNYAFGSNLLDLYTDPFFINTGLIGRFAQEKINKVLDYINLDDKDINIDKNDEYQFIIDSIGDQNIRLYLQKLYYDKIRRG